RVGRHRCGLAELAPAERALVEDALVGRRHRDDARHLLRLDGLLEARVHVLEGRHGPSPSACFLACAPEMLVAPGLEVVVRVAHEVRARSPTFSKPWTTSAGQETQSQGPSTVSARMKKTSSHSCWARR